MLQKAKIRLCITKGWVMNENQTVSNAGQDYRFLTTEDTIQEGDEWYNPYWEVGGPWYKIEHGNHSIGDKYLDSFRPIRRTYAI